MGPQEFLSGTVPCAPSIVGSEGIVRPNNARVLPVGAPTGRRNRASTFGCRAPGLGRSRRPPPPAPWGGATTGPRRSPGWSAGRGARSGRRRGRSGHGIRAAASASNWPASARARQASSRLRPDDAGRRARVASSARVGDDVGVGGGRDTARASRPALEAGYGARPAWPSNRGGTNRSPILLDSASTTIGRAGSRRVERRQQPALEQLLAGLGRPGRAPNSEPRWAASPSRSSVCTPRAASRCSISVLAEPVLPSSSDEPRRGSSS